MKNHIASKRGGAYLVVGMRGMFYRESYCDVMTLYEFQIFCDVSFGGGGGGLCPYVGNECDHGLICGRHNATGF